MLQKGTFLFYRTTSVSGPEQEGAGLRFRSFNMAAGPISERNQGKRLYKSPSFRRAPQISSRTTRLDRVWSDPVPHDIVEAVLKDCRVTWGTSLSCLFRSFPPFKRDKTAWFCHLTSIKEVCN